MTTKMTWEKLLSEQRPNPSENSKFDIDNPFEEDYYTIINSSYFRRLKDKTQIFTMDNNDSIRNRLTHSLEVSSIGEIIGIKLSKKLLNSEYKDEVVGCDIEKNLPMILRCAGLLHDIGNPPFGHQGEEYIRSFFRNNFKREDKADSKEDKVDSNIFYKIKDEQLRADLENFEGNAQGLRIATKLGKSFFDGHKSHYGLNLTCAVLSCIIKYPISSLEKHKQQEDERKAGKKEDEIKYGKIGFYFTEQRIVNKVIAKNVGTFDTENNKILKNPIMFLLEAADDIAYATADFEDGVRKDKIDKYRLNNKELNAEIEKLNSPENENELEYSMDLTEVVQAHMQKIRKDAIDKVVDKFFDNYEKIMTGEYEDELVPDDIKNLKNICETFYHDRDLKNNAILDSEKRIHGILKYLIEVLRTDKLTLSQFVIKMELKQYIDKVKSVDKYELEWDNDKKKIDWKEKQAYCDYLVVTDFVSGMTDGYVEKFWNKLYDIERKEAREYISLLPERIEKVNSKYKARKMYEELRILSQVLCEDDDYDRENTSSNDIISNYSKNQILIKISTNEHIKAKLSKRKKTNWSLK